MGEFRIGGDFIQQAGNGNVGKIVHSGAPSSGRGPSSAARPEAQVLIVTVNDIETEAVQVGLEGLGLTPRLVFGPVNSYTLYGPVNGATVAQVRSGMGSTGQRASTLTVADAIRDLRPTAVIAVGIAFGIDESTQPIGQLLLSERLTNYERAKIGTAPNGGQLVLERGSSTECSARLIGRFLACQPLSFPGVDVRTGEVLSGEKLVDNASFRGALLTRFPEAIGGEMEGAGIQAASGRENVEWIVAKAVADYASHKSVDRVRRQRVAAANAAHAVIAVLKAGGLAHS